VLSVRVPLTERDRVDQAAYRAGLTRSALILRAVRAEVSRVERTLSRRAA
jgi:hypothetical protein